MAESDVGEREEYYTTSFKIIGFILGNSISIFDDQTTISLAK
jgi:hypothetical protein